MTNASVQRGRQGLCEEANEPAPASESGADFRRVGHPRDHPLQVEEVLAIAGGGGAGIGEGT